MNKFLLFFSIVTLSLFSCSTRPTTYECITSQGILEVSDQDSNVRISGDWLELTTDNVVVKLSLHECVAVRPR